MEPDEKYNELIASYLKGELTAAGSKELFAWLQLDAKNREVFSQSQSIWNATQWPEEQFTPDVEKAWARFRARIDASGKPQGRIFRITPQILKIAASVAIILSISYLLGRWALEPKMILVQTASNEKREFYLPDSSKIFLNKNSEVSYSSNFKEKRIIDLKGEAFFEVTKRSGKNFVIYAANSRTEVLGTSFSVNAYEGKLPTVQVLTGVVAFSDKNSTNIVFLAKGDEAKLEENMKVTKTSISDSNFLAWKNNQLVFKNTDLLQVIRALENYFSVPIKIENAALLKCRFTGSFEKPAIQEIMNILASSVNLTYKRTDKEIVLSGQGCK